MRASYSLPIAFSSAPQQPQVTPIAPAPTGAPAEAPATAATGAAGTQQPAPRPPEEQSGGMMLYLLPAMLLLMYFMVFRPEQKRRKQQQDLLSSIKVGDRVVTVGGLHGVVGKLSDKTVTIKVDAIQATFDRVAIARVERDDAPAQGKA